MEIMRKNLIVSSISGIVLGATVSLLNIHESGLGLLISIVICILFGVITVVLIKPYANLYALFVSVISSLIILLNYGLENGLVYSLGVVFIYAIFSVQLSIASINSFDNVKYLVSKLSKKE